MAGPVSPDILKHSLAKAKKKSGEALVKQASAPGNPGGEHDAAYLAGQAAAQAMLQNNGSPSGPSQLAPVAPAAPATDYDSLAKSIFAPEFGNLDAQQSALQSQAGTADSNIAKLYANLVGSIQGDASSIKGNYGQAETDTKANTAAGIGGIGSIYDESAAKEAALLSRLGIQAAAPDVLAQGTKDRGLYEGALQANGTASLNELASNLASDLQFNTSQANISKETGVGKQADVQTALQAALAQLATQRSSLQSQELQQAQSMSSTANSQRITEENDQAKNDVALATLQAKYPSGAASNAPANATQNAKLLAAAQSMYPAGDISGAANGAKAIEDTLLANGIPKNIADFEQQVLARNKPKAGHFNDQAELLSLAQYMFQLLGLKNPTPIQ